MQQGINGVPEQLSGMINRFSYTRTGTVTFVNPQFATVEIGAAETCSGWTSSTPCSAAYIRQTEPEIGDLVVVTRQGASWLVVGTTSVSGGNEVQNPSFEEVTTGDQPVGWTLYNITNTSGMLAIGYPDRVMDGDRLLEVGPTGVFTGTSFVYSQPIGVESGQVWELSAAVNGWYPSPGSGFDNTADPGLYALWFANATNLYPTTSNADTAVQTASNIEDTPVPRVLRGNATVPVGAEFMRVGLRSAVAQYTALHWDIVTARRVS